jgi:hypothetical protein
VALRIMSLDMQEVRCVVKGRNVPIQVPNPSMDVWIPRSYVPDVAFEVLNVYRVETDDGHEAWKN